MTTVDERIVSLGFENEDFERGVAESLNTLDDLRDGLDLTDSVKELTQLQDAGDNFNLNGIADGAQAAMGQFSALGVIGFTVLQNLTNSVIDLGQRFYHALLGPMRSGFSEYETQMNAIQTVLANTAKAGTTLDDVNAALAELNLYADQTIYNFTEMTRNIGTFTAAGISLDTSVAAIKGIANLAAVSGSNATQASTAMYQLSQALSAGTLKLQDWNSVVNAGMGGKIFQDALMETARVHGIAIDEILEKEGSFRNTLSEGWISQDILTETLAKFTGDLTAAQLETMGYTKEQIAGILELGQTASDAATKVKTFTQLQDTLQEAIQSGWTRTWELIIGDFDEAKDTFTEISDTLGGFIATSSAARNELLLEWKNLGGRVFLRGSLREGFESLLAFIEPIKNAFTDIFPTDGLTGKALKDLTFRLYKFTKALRISDEVAGQVRRVFRGLFSVIGIAADIINLVLDTLGEKISEVSIPFDSFLDVLANAGDAIVAFRERGDYLAVLSEYFNTFEKTVRSLWNTIIDSGSQVWNTLTGIFDAFQVGFKNVDTAGLIDFFDQLDDRFRPLGILAEWTGRVLSGFLEIAQNMTPTLSRLASLFADAAGELANGLITILENTDFVLLVDQLNAALISAILISIRQFIMEGKNAFSSLGGVFKSASDGISTTTGAFAHISEVLDTVRDSLETWQQTLRAKSLISLASAVGILALSLMALSLIDSVKLTTALGTVTALVVDLMASMKVLMSSSSGFISSIALLTGLAVAIFVLSMSVKLLAGIENDDAVRGVAVITALTVGLLAVNQMLESSNISMKAIAGLIGFAVAIGVLGIVVKKVGELDEDILVQGLEGLGAMLIEVALFTQLVNSSGIKVSSGLALIAISISILLLAKAVQQLSLLDGNALERGVGAIGALLAELSLFTQLIGNQKHLVRIALGLGILALSLGLLSYVVIQLSRLSWSELATGLVGLAGALLVISVTVRALPKNMLVIGVGLITVGAALILISEALIELASLSLEEIGTGLLGMAGALLILAVASTAMNGAIVGAGAILLVAVALNVLAGALKILATMKFKEVGSALLALAGSFVIMAIAGTVMAPMIPVLAGLAVVLLLLGAAVALFGVGLATFAGGLASLAVAGGAGAAALVAVASTVLGLLPVAAQVLVDTITSFVNGIALASPVISAALTALLVGLLDIVIAVAPQFWSAISEFLKGFIKTVVEITPDIIDAFFVLISALLTKLEEYVPDFVTSGLNVLMGFLNGIRDNIFELTAVVFDIMTEFLRAVEEKLPDITDAGISVLVTFINSVAAGVDTHADEINAAITKLADAIIDGLVSGISNGAAAVVNAVISVANGAAHAAMNALHAHSPSRVFIKIGQTIPSGLVLGIQEFASKVGSAITALTQTVINGMNDALNVASLIIDGDLSIAPKVTPVVDMGEIEQAINTTEALFRSLVNYVEPGVTLAYGVLNNQLRSQPDSLNTKTDGTNTQISYVQNIYSPTPLNRYQIYRNTRSQLRLLEVTL